MSYISISLSLLDTIPHCATSCTSPQHRLNQLIYFTELFRQHLPYHGPKLADVRTVPGLLASSQAATFWVQDLPNSASDGRMS